LALARALYGDPFLVVLDEPNSNLDAEGEEALTRAILGVRARGGVAIVVAHRPSVLAAVDHLLAMARGAQQAFGPKDEILPRLVRRETPAPGPLKVVPHAGGRGMASNICGDELQSIRRHLLGGGLLALLPTAGLGGWGATTEPLGAVIASGSVVVDSNVKKVQHLTGGIVGELLVRDGSRVRAGDIVVRLDETIMRANLAIVVKGMAEMQARQARLAGERDRTDEIAFPAALLARPNDPDVARAIDSERKLFGLRRSARAGQKAQLQERISQLEEEVRAHVALQQAKAEEIELIQRELDGVRTLWNKNLVQLTRLTALEREAVRLKGERAQSFSAAAQARGKITEPERQIIQIAQDLSSEVAKELREVDMKIGELIERQVTAEDQLKHVEIRAPQDGVVHQLEVHTVGGVVTPADPIMLIVPE